jgi:hypothetical protein
MVGAAGLRTTPGVEMWNAGSNLGEADLLLTTVNQISNWSDVTINSQPVTIVGIDSPALEWLLRGHLVNVIPSLDATTSPPIVITTDQNNPTLAAGYRGQSFSWREQTLWDNQPFSSWLHWIAFRDLPQNQETVIVWVRSDLFIDSTAPKP